MATNTQGNPLATSNNARGGRSGRRNLIDQLRTWWRARWHHRIFVGDPKIPESWYEYHYDQFRATYPPFDLGQIVLTGESLRILLFRWIFCIDPWFEIAYFLPLIWLEFMTNNKRSPGLVSGRHIRLQLTVPPERGKIVFGIALSGHAIRDMHGILSLNWERWNDETSPEDGTYAEGD